MLRIKGKEKLKTIMTDSRTNLNERMIREDILQRDLTFRYQLLGRMQSDCEYYLGYGNRNERRLWAGNVKLHIKLMAELHGSFKEEEKPKWLTLDEIMAYGEKMAVAE